MAPQRRPPPLPKSLFTGSGPLAPGSAKLPASPSTLHPSAVVDAEYDGTLGKDADLLASSYGGKVPLGLVVRDSTVQGPSVVPVVPLPETATFGTDKLPTSTSKVLDILINPLSMSMRTDAEWDKLEGQLDDLAGNPAMLFGLGNTSLDGGKPPITDEAKAERSRPIVLTGLLLPLMDGSLQPSQLVQHPLHTALWAPRIASLSLKVELYLKVTPPVVDLRQVDQDATRWWEQRGQVKECVRVYLAHALECFGAHRLLFATCLPTSSSLPDGIVQPIPGDEWYGLLRECLAELVAAESEVPAREALDDVFGGVAKRLYGL